MSLVRENVAGRMFKNGKNTILTGKISTPEEVVKGFDDVTMDDIENMKRLICDFSSYSAVVVSKKHIELKRIMKGGPMKIRIISKSGVIPEYKTSGSAGFDLPAYLEESITLKPGERRLVPHRHLYGTTTWI